MSEEKFNNVSRSRKTIFVNNFLGGIAWGFGVTVGFAVLFILLGALVAKVNLVPYVGEFVADVANEVLQKNPQLVE